MAGGLVGRLTTWLAGADYEILRRIGTDRFKYGSIGAAILITGVMACVSMTFALVTVLDVGLPVALVFAAGWGLLIISLDRTLVISLQRQERWWRYLFPASTRLALALVVGFLISTPFTLQIFHPEIAHEVKVLQAAAANAYFKEVRTSPLTKEIASDKNEIAALSVVASTGGPGSNLAKDPTLATLTTDRAEVQRLETKYLDAWNCQLYGPRSKCPATGNGPVAETDRQDYLAEKAQVTLYTREIDARQNYLIAREKVEQSKNRANASGQLTIVRQALKVAQAEQDQETADFLRTNKKDDGLLIRLQALSVVASQSFTVNFARWLLFSAFALIELLPVVAKLLLNFGKKTAYELEVDQQEQAARSYANIRRDEYRKALRQRMPTFAGELVDWEIRAERSALRAAETAGAGPSRTWYRRRAAMPRAGDGAGLRVPTAQRVVPRHRTRSARPPHDRARYRARYRAGTWSPPPFTMINGQPDHAQEVDEQPIYLQELGPADDQAERKAP